MTTAIERAVKPEIEAKQISPMALIQEALRGAVTPEEKQAAAGIVKELIALQQSMVRFEWEAQERQSKIDFDDALNACQAQIGRIAPNQKRENSIMWADYAQLDRAVRPVYIAAGFSIGFSEMESADPSRLHMRATVSRGGVSREYFSHISRTAANGKMSQPDADAGAASRVKRYLLLDIFNIAIGIDQAEKKPFVEGEGMAEKVVLDFIAAIEATGDQDELQTVYFKARDMAQAAKDVRAVEAFANSKNRRLGQLNRAKAVAK